MDPNLGAECDAFQKLQENFQEKTFFLQNNVELLTQTAAFQVVRVLPREMVIRKLLIFMTTRHENYSGFATLFIIFWPFYNILAILF